WVKEINPSLKLKSKIYPIIVHGVRTTFDPSNRSHLESLMSDNRGLLDSLQRVIWSNQTSIDAKKSHSSIIIHLTRPTEANLAILNKVSFRGELLRTEHSYCHILQCHQCLDFGHMARTCPNNTLCTHCGRSHAFSECDSRDDPLTCANCLQ
ncbi:hypothetical protein CROQUDRAFT_20864, partial [Cronartium quercuum f. sp. fusiforme G11]